MSRKFTSNDKTLEGSYLKPQVMVMGRESTPTPMQLNDAREEQKNWICCLQYKFTMTKRNNPP